MAGLSWKARQCDRQVCRVRGSRLPRGLRRCFHCRSGRAPAAGQTPQLCQGGVTPTFRMGTLRFKTVGQFDQDHTVRGAGFRTPSVSPLAPLSPHRPVLSAGLGLALWPGSPRPLSGPLGVAAGSDEDSWVSRRSQ